MKYLIFILISLIFIQCEDEIYLPTCDFIIIEQTPERLSLTIESEDPFITLCREFPENTKTRECWTIWQSSYDCATFAYFPGEIFYIYSSSGDCIIQAQ